MGDELGEASGVNTCGWKERGEKGKGQAKGKLNGDVPVGTAWANLTGSPAAGWLLLGDLGEAAVKGE